MKRVFVFLMVLLLLVGLMPVQVLAAGGHAITVVVEGDGSATAPATANAGESVYVNCVSGAYTELKRITGVGPDGEFQIYPNEYYRTEFTMPDGPVTVTVKFGAIGDDEEDDGFDDEDSGIHSIYLLSAGGGTPTADKYTATAGQTVTVTPNPNTGNVFKNIQIDYYRTDGHNEIYYLSDGVTSFVMPDDIETGGVVKVTVYYERDPNAGPVTTPQKIDTYADGHGTISAPETAVPGSTVTVSIVPDEGNKVTYLYAMDQATGAELKMTRVGKTEYTFTMPENWAYIIVQFGAGEDDYVPGGGDDEGDTDDGNTDGGDIDDGTTDDDITDDDITDDDTTDDGTTDDDTTDDGTTDDDTTDDGTTDDGTTDDDSTDEDADDQKPTAIHTTDSVKNAYRADINLEDAAVLEMLLDSEDWAKNEDMRVYMTVEKLADAAVPAAQKIAIDNKAGSDKIAAYLDINLWKQVGSSDPVTIPNPNGIIPITMTLESGLIPADARSVYIIYYHDGAVKTIQPTAFEASAGYLAFNANEFSVYSLVYKTGTAEETTPNTTSGTLDNVPKTGGSSALLTWTMLGLCSTAMLAGVAVYDKKRAR